MINIIFSQENYTPLFWIAEFLTVIGLFFAAYQLKTPEWELRIRYENNFLKNMKRRFILSGILSLLGFLLLLIFDYQSKFWEIWSLVILLYIWCCFRGKITTPIKKIENVENFKKLIIDFLGRWEEKIAILWSELGYFFEDLINKIEEGNNEAYQILILYMDSRLSKNLICNQYNTIQKIIKVYKTKVYVWEIHKIFLSSIIHTSLSDNDSIIARALIEGKNTILLTQIFEKFSFISSYDLYKETFGGINNSKNDRELTTTYFNNYLRFFEQILESFFDKNHIKENIVYHQTLYFSMKRFSGELWYDWLLRNNYENMDIPRIIVRMYSKITDIMDEKIKDFFIKDYSYIPSKPPFTFIDTIAHGVFELLKSIAYIPERKDNTERIWQLCHMLYPFWNSTIFILIKQRINEYILRHIKDIDKEWYYPHMTRIFFHIFAWKIFQQETDYGQEKNFYIEVLKEIKTWLFLLAHGKYFEIDSFANWDREMQEKHKEKIIEIVKDMLWPNILFNPTDETLTYYDSFDKKNLDLTKLDDNIIAIS